MSSRLGIAGIVLLAAFGLAACGGGGSGTATEPPPPPPPTPYQSALAAINAAATADAAQAAYDAVKDDVTATEGDRLQAAVNARQAALATMARAAMQRAALATAAGNIDTSDLSTQDAVDAARTAIAGLRGALAAAADVSAADKAMYMTRLDTAVAAVDAAQGGIDTATRRTNQMTALSDASTALQTALAALGGSPTQALVNAANTALAGLNAALTGAADLTDTEKAPYQREATNASAPIQTAQTAVNDAKSDADKAAAAAMAAKAAKLYAGIVARNTTDGADERNAEYAGTNDANIMVTIGTGDGNTATLMEDKKTTVATNHGWTGKRYADPAGGDSYEARVYSNVEASKPGKPFGRAGTAAGTTYQYTLNADGVYDVGEDAADAKIAFTNVTRTAGTETFKLPDPNDNNQQIITVPGKYHGVSGTYRCDTGSDRTSACTASVAANGGFSLAGTWTFKPTTASDKVMSLADAVYASYGWWLKKSADGKYTASAFVDVKGTSSEATDDDDLASGLGNLNGTATYRGGAAGQYALSSATGGTNDAGHFTARATLEANFTTNTAETAITGTIDNFIGADGESRDWEVELKGSQIGDNGVIGNASESTGVKTVWTIGGTAGAAAGQWTGNLRNNGTDGVPKVATGTFYSTYGTAGRMVGAFGANKQ